MAFQRWQRAVENTDDSDLNLIPVMNLFMVLIPFLMLGAAFYHIGVIPVSTPTHNPSESDVPTTPKTVTANLVVTSDSVKLTFSSTSLTEDELFALSAQWPADKDGKFDLEAIQGKLKEIKATYPKSNTVVVLPQDEVEYQTLVSVLDIMREYQSGVDSKGEPRFNELFPVTVFSRFIPPPPERSEEGSEEGSEGEGEGEGEEGDDAMNFAEEDVPAEEPGAPAPSEEEGAP